VNNIILSSLLIISSTLLGNLVLYGIRKRKVPGVFIFSILMLAMAIHSAGYAFELLSESLGNMYLCIRIEYIGAAFYPFFIMLFAREYADEKKFANKYVLTLILTVNIVTLVLVNTNSYHGLYYSSVGIDTSPGFPILALKKGVWYMVQVAALYFSILYSVIVFSIKLKRTRGDYRIKAAYMLMGVSIPMLTFIIYMLGLGPVYIDLTPFSYLLMSILIIVGLLRYDILILTPITHEMVFNSIGEAVLVIDKNQMLINFNNASRMFFPSLAKIKVGESIHMIQELDGYDFASGQPIYEVNGRIFSFKAVNIKNNKVSIYVVNDITESEQAKKQLEILATKDALTGLYNRRYFMEKIEDSTGEGILVIIDLDHFKSINDTFGHVEGDKVLNYFARESMEAFSNQIVCRYGGEEFAILIADTDIQRVFGQLDAIRDKINSRDHEVTLTFSAGLAKFEEGNIQEALIRADQKLYEAKENGRNQTKY
jgi:diguanylate cyclase (GGDEF)-like protein